jgi:ParB family chromosome partitioning protein
MTKKTQTRKAKANPGKTSKLTVDPVGALQEDQQVDPEPPPDEILTGSAELPGEPMPEFIRVREELIDFSPLQYRKYYDPVALAEFSEDLKIRSILHPLTVRIVVSGRYELAVGERRLRGGRMAGLSLIPIFVRDLTDEQVEEIQLSENIQREDPHPMHEAEAIARMYARGLSTDEVAARLGKSKSFVFQRLRLSQLVPDIQEMFLANVFNLTQALEISSLAPEGQQAFFDAQCSDWKTETLSLWNLRNVLSTYKYDLIKAPFDTTNETLLAEAGACSVCSHNSACQSLLFPSQASEAHCTKGACFEQKVRLNYGRTISVLMAEHNPVALIYTDEGVQQLKTVIEKVEVIKDLPVYTEHDITELEEPARPQKEDFEYNEEECYGDDDEEQADQEDEKESSSFVEENYNAAIAEYEEEMEVYRAAVTDGKALKGIRVSADGIMLTYYYPVPSRSTEKGERGPKVNIQDAIKAGKDTPEMLEEAIERINKRAVRFKELDREAVQKEIHRQLLEATTAEGVTFTMTEADQMAVRWLVYGSLTHANRDTVKMALGFSFGWKAKQEEVYEAIKTLTEDRFIYLIRMAMTGLSESKSPQSITANFFYKLAEGAGINTTIIEKKQETKANNRRDNQELKISLYKKRLKRHRKAVA